MAPTAATPAPSDRELPAPGGTGSASPPERRARRRRRGARSLPLGLGRQPVARWSRAPRRQASPFWWAGARPVLGAEPVAVRGGLLPAHSDDGLPVGVERLLTVAGAVRGAELPELGIRHLARRDVEGRCRSTWRCRSFAPARPSRRAAHRELAGRTNLQFLALGLAAQRGCSPTTTSAARPRRRLRRRTRAQATTRPRNSNFDVLRQAGPRRNRGAVARYPARRISTVWRVAAAAASGCRPRLAVDVQLRILGPDAITSPKIGVSSTSTPRSSARRHAHLARRGFVTPRLTPTDCARQVGAHVHFERRAAAEPPIVTSAPDGRLFTTSRPSRQAEPHRPDRERLVRLHLHVADPGLEARMQQLDAARCGGQLQRGGRGAGVADVRARTGWLTEPVRAPTPAPAFTSSSWRCRSPRCRRWPRSKVALGARFTTTRGRPGDANSQARGRPQRPSMTTSARNAADTCTGPSRAGW